METENRPNRDLIVENGYEGVTIFESPNYDSAIIGMSNEGRVIYDYEKMAEYLMDTDDMTYEEAIEFIEYNTIRAIPYFPNGPTVLMEIPDMDDEYFLSLFDWDDESEHKLPEYKFAIIGISHDDRVIYDENIYDYLINEKKMTREEAEEHIETLPFNPLVLIPLTKKE